MFEEDLVLQTGWFTTVGSWLILASALTGVDSIRETENIFLRKVTTLFSFFSVGHLIWTAEIVSLFMFVFKKVGKSVYQNKKRPSVLTFAFVGH